MPRQVTINYARLLGFTLAGDLSSLSASYTVGHVEPDGTQTDYPPAIKVGRVTVSLAPTDTNQTSFAKLAPAISAAEGLDFSKGGGDQLFMP